VMADDVVRVMRPDGTLCGEAPEMSDDEVIALYTLLVRTRVIDERAVALQRQGRIGFHIGSLGEEATIIGPHPVAVHDSATLYPNVVLDAEHGPIAIHERAVVRPGAVICGPSSIGRDSTIIDHALIKPNTVIGPVCKIGGEVGGTIFQGYSNKCHDGHLGDSWVGKWVNFGAGTTNSNLLNTYGEVAMRLDPQGPIHKTGMTFIGTIVGDHVKLSINTRLMTGTLIGTGAMIATTAAPPMVVRRFAWLTDRGEQMFRFQKFLDTARSMMARRDREPSEAYIEAMSDLHKQAKAAKEAKAAQEAKEPN